MGGCLWNVSVRFLSVESDINEYPILPIKNIPTHSTGNRPYSNILEYDINEYTRKEENRREEKIDSDCKQNEATTQATDTHR